MKTFQLFILILSFGAAVNGSLAADAQTTAKPNIILFLVDDMGWMDSTAYGSQYYETPKMKRLERQSMRFANAYATPLCSPTRASILSGQYSSRHGVTSASGPLTLRLRARSTAGGEGRVQWRTATQETFPESTQIVTYRLSAETKWQDVSIQLPIQGNARVVRLYLPAEKSAVEVQSIQFLDKSGRKKAWDFAATFTGDR